MVKRYSKSIGWIAVLLSIYSLLHFFLISNPIWLAIGLSLLLVLLILLTGKEESINILNLRNSNKIAFKIFSYLASVIFSISSLYGMYLAIKLLPLNDKSFLMIPIFIFSIFIVSVSIGLLED